MKLESVPTLRIETERMKSSILAHLGVVGSELGEALSVEIDKAVASYPWEEQVRTIVHATLTQEIDSYFKYGEGRDKVAMAVKEGFDKVLGSGGGE